MTIPDVRLFVKLVLTLLLLYSPALPDTIVIKGIVQSESGRLISGANVYLKHNDLSAITDTGGRFQITKSANFTIVGSIKNHRCQIRLNGTFLHIAAHTSAEKFKITAYALNGKRIVDFSVQTETNGDAIVNLEEFGIPSGVAIITVQNKGIIELYKLLASANRIHLDENSTLHAIRSQQTNMTSRQAASTTVQDTLFCIANNFISKYLPLNTLVQDSILITLTPMRYDNVTPGIPMIRDGKASGDVTTYGSVSNPEFSEGGACGYESTGILYYAAINVHKIPGDFLGQWQDGRACGQCARVRVFTQDGWKSTVVRITDRCADSNCGIDLGGAPARDVMGTQPGRYAGEWEWVSCDSGINISDNPVAIHVKSGSNSYWSLIQVRNGIGSVNSIRARKTEADQWIDLTWATEAEGYFKVPATILQSNDNWTIEILWKLNVVTTIQLPGNALARANAVYPLE